MESSLVKDNPLLLAINRQKTIYDGFITVQVTESNILSCYYLRHCHFIILIFKDVFSPSLDSSQRLQQSADLVSFMLELKTVMEVGLKSRPECSSIPPPQYYSQLISEMETLGWDKLLSIDTEFQTLRLKVQDSAGRQHILIIKLKSKHPAEAPECSADLPLPLLITWTPQSTLAQIHHQFLLVLESLTEFWDVLDEIDRQTWILEPEKPSRSDTMRRIAIGNNVSIKVEVDPKHPKMLPECCLLGAELGASCLWSACRNPDSSLLLNLQDVLEIEFPSPATHEKSAFSVECGICYSYRLEAELPDQVCNNPCCGQPFHQTCLYEWLRALPSSRQSFSVVFGECPYCSKPITVKMPTHQF
uniref:RING-type domain-containing protein n=1 Tax=Echeneis naucrates TaxID=173247 RepID=A0A665T7W4_ECHNA